MQHEILCIHTQFAILQTAQLCASLLKSNAGLEKKSGDVMAHCLTQIAKKVSKWKESDECQECKESGSDWSLCIIYVCMYMAPHAVINLRLRYK